MSPPWRLRGVVQQSLLHTAGFAAEASVRPYRAVAEGYRDLERGGILALTIFSAPGRATGTAVTQVLARGASVMRIHEGRVTKLVVFFHRDHAFADLGLAPEGDAA
jgi:hypothetical protein